MSTLSSVLGWFKKAEPKQHKPALEVLETAPLARLVKPADIIIETHELVVESRAEKALDVLEDVLWLPRSPKGNVIKFPGRTMYGNPIIEFYQPVKLGQKIRELRFGLHTYCGVFPIQDLGNNQYLCSIDYIKEVE